MLKDLIAASGAPGDPARILYVSSGFNILGQIKTPADFDEKIELDYGDGWIQSLMRYSDSKLLQIYLSDELARQFREEGANAESVALHPGTTKDIPGFWH